MDLLRQCTLFTVFPLEEEISRYKQEKQLKAPCVVQDGPCCFSIFKHAKLQDYDLDDCYHVEPLHHVILMHTC